ncbi:MAG: hypothetical protein ACRED5_12805 [Propylenella sp.]
MTSAPSLSIRLFGTEEVVEAPRQLRAGDLSADLEAGNLRYIRFGGCELLRAVSFIVRDRNWGTCNPEISNLSIKEDARSFSVTYDALCKDAAQAFRYSAEITGFADGRLTFRGKGRAATDFVTNRTGFVVLHSVDGVAGHPVRIEHVDGRIVEGAFPSLIDPVQPMMELRALTHEAAPNLWVTCRMEGDTYEMEDQRNWTDASYKTYVRPLALPWPYTLKAGREIEQTVIVTVEGKPPSRLAGNNVVRVKIGAPVGAVPALGLGLDPDDAQSALANAAALSATGPAYLVCHHDARRGHDREAMQRCVEVARGIGARPWLEAVIAKVDGFEDEVASLGEMAKSLGNPFGTVLVSPAPDLKCTLPGSPWPLCPPADALYEAARKAFPEGRLGGGMFSYFTELNRKRPPTDLLDFVTFTTSPLVHAGDDRSLMESLEALPYVAESARAIAGDKPIAIGPSAIGMRDNPYGAAPMQNPGNIRQAMNRNDPRQRGLSGAAWNLGYFARFAYGGAESIALGGAGPFALVHAPEDWPQPWYDENGGLFPVFHVVRGLAALAKRPLLAIDNDAPGQVQGLATEGESGPVLWLANLTAEPKQVEVFGIDNANVATLDADGFALASREPEFLDKRTERWTGESLALPPYAVARLLGH